MEIKKEKKTKPIHLLLSSYTIGFVLGSLGFFISEMNKDFQLDFSKESILCLLIIFPIIYWVYRYSGMAFNDQNLKVKLLYFALFILGIFLGLLFFELSLN